MNKLAFLLVTVALCSSSWAQDSNAAKKIDALVIVNGMQLHIDLVELGKPYEGMTPTHMTEDQTVLAIRVIVPESVNLDTVGNMKVWVTDNKGVRYEVAAALIVEQNPVWLFAVAKTSESFILHFPSGKTVDLSSLLR